MAGQTVVVSVLADTKKFAQSMDSIGGSTSKLGAGLKSFGVAAAATVAAAGVAVGVFAGKAISAASNLEQAIGGVDAVFKSNSDTVHKWAKDAAQNLGLNQTAYSELATVIGSQLTNMGVATDQVAGQTNDLITMGADLAAQFGGSTSDAVSALSSLLRGERDPIEAYGVSMNQAAIDAKVAEMGLAGLTGEAKKNAELQATLAILNQQTASSMGAFARESDTLAGSQARLKASMENTVSTLGTAMLPAATAGTGALAGLLSTVTNSEGFSNFVQWLSTASQGLADMLSGNNDLVGGILTLIQGFSPLGILLNAITPILPQLASSFGQIGSILATGLNTLLPVLVPLFDQVAGVVGTLIASLLPPMVSIFGALMGVIVAILPPIVGLVTQLIGFLAPILEKLTPLFTMVADIIGGVLNAVLPILTTLIETVSELFDALFPILMPIIDAVLGIVTAVLPLIGLVGELIGALLPPLIDLFMSLLKPILDLITPLIGLLAPAIQFVAEVLAAIIGVVVQVITWFVKLITGSEDAQRDISNVWNAILNFFSGIPAAIGAFFSNAANFLVSAGSNIINGLRNGVQGAISGVWNFFNSVVSNVFNFFANAGSWLVNAGRNILSGLVNGIANGAQAVYNMIRGVVGNVIDFAKRLLGIASPSKVFKKFGQFTIRGLEAGLNGPNHLDSIMSGITGQVVNGFNPNLAMDVGGRVGRFGGNTYNVTVNAGVGDPVQIGREIKSYINDYERFGGGL